MEDRKIPFFKRLKLAIFNLERYQDFALEKTSTAFKYFAKLILLFTAIICIALTYQYTMIAKTGIQIIKEEVPDFVFENNTLSSKDENATIIEKSENRIDYCIVIDTNRAEDSSEFNEYTKKLNLYGIGAIFLKDKVILKTSMSNNIQSFSYETISSQYDLGSFDKQRLIEMLDGISPASAIIALYLTLVLYLFCSYFIATLLETILLFILGFFTAKIVGVKLKNTQIYNLTFYALTLPILLNAIYIPINVLTGFTVKYFQMMYTTISYIYIITSVLLIRSQIIKQQAEVDKIKEVQKEVRQDLLDKEKKETDDKKEENEEEDKNKDVNTGDEEPEGSM